MGRLIVAAMVTLAISGCAVVTAIPSMLVDSLVYMFQGAEESFSMSMRASLVSVQRAMKKSGLSVNVLEPVDDGYLIAFGNEKLNGKITIEKQTDGLTTIGIKVKKRGMRQDSIERALIEATQEQGRELKSSDHFDFTNYRDIREEPEATSKRVGWYLPGTLIEVYRISNSEWMRIKMPSGNTAYLKGSVAASASK